MNPLSVSHRRRRVTPVLLTAGMLAASALLLIPEAAGAVSSAGSATTAPAVATGPPASIRTAQLGVFLSDGDDVHLSSTPPTSASVHGWWRRLSGPGTVANVTVTLQSLDYFGHWRTVASGSKVVKSGGGRGNRATARRVCLSPVPGLWQSFVDVDIIGVDDSPERAFSAEQSVRCSA